MATVETGTGGSKGAVQHFDRSAGRVVMDLVLAPIGALVFLGVAAAAASGALAADPLMRLVFACVFGFFGLVMAAGALVTIRRGPSRTMLEVGPEGIWTPELGRLRWDEIAEVRLESMRGPGAVSGSTARYRQLGIVPRDPARRPAGAMAVGSVLTGSFTRFVRLLDPSIRIGATSLAPFGVAEYELERPIAEVVRSVARFHPVVDVDAGSTALPIAAPATGAPTGVAAADGSLPPHGPRMVFHRPLPSPIRIYYLAVSLVGPGVFIWIALTQIAPRNPDFAILFAGFAGVGLALGLVSAWTTLAPYRHGLGETLAVGPDGIETPELGRLAWAEVREIATERARFVLGAHERWRLVIVPLPWARVGQRYVVAADDLDRPFDDVLTLIRIYHAVAERR